MVKGIEDGIKVRQNEFGYGPIASMEHALDKNYRAGIIAGMRFAVVYANAMHTQLEEAVETELAKQQEKVQ